MTKPKGRSDDMLKIRGVNVFPSQIEEVILGIEELGPHYEIILEREGYLDKLTVKVDETVLFDDDVVILAQEIKEFSVANALANLEAGQHKITVTTATAVP